MIKHLRPIPSALLVAIVVVGFAACVNAQTNNPEESVRAVIDELFDAMRTGDGDAVSRLFHESATMSSISVRDGQPMIRSSGSAEFVAAVGSPHEEVWDERIWNVEIKVDGAMANAWVPYAFYLGDSFSHCGTNSFTLFESTDGWKITGITDTRRQSNCGIPPEIAGQ